MDSTSIKNKLKGFLGTSATTVANIITPIKDHDFKEVVSRDKFWKIYNSYKKTTNQECSLFVFEKKLYEKLPKGNLESIIKFLKKEATTLQRLRHPSILQVVSVMEETKSNIYFATEPILATLADLLDNYRQRKKSTVDSSSTSEEGYKKKDFTFEELELKSGIFQILEGLFFLNQTAKLLHRNISPESIFITKSLKWKLGGLGFTCSIETKEPVISDLSYQDLKEYLYHYSGGSSNNTYHTSSSSTNAIVEQQFILPKLEYLSPEFILQRKFENNSDLFSVGRLIFELSINLEENAIDGQLINQISKLGVTSYYNTILEQVRKAALNVNHNHNQQRSIGDSAKVCTILLGDPALRGDLDNFIRSSYFQDILTKTLLYLSNISQKEEESKLQFFRGLLRIIQQFSPRIQNNYILPVLLSECTNNDGRLVYVLFPNIMSIASQHIKKETFQEKVLPAISHILTSKEPKPEVLSCVLDNLQMLLLKCSIDQIKKILLPIVLGTMCGPTNEIIFQCLSFSQPIAKFFDAETISIAVIPRLTNLCTGGFPVHIRTKAVQWFTLLVPSMEKKLIVDTLIPNLEKILSGDNSPIILSSIVETYEALSKKLGGELLAKSVLPALIPLSTDKHIDLEQFKTVMKVIRDILNTYEQERLTELSNLQRYSSNNTQSIGGITTTTTTTTSPNQEVDHNDTSFITNLDNNNNNNNGISPINLTLPSSFIATTTTATPAPLIAPPKSVSPLSSSGNNPFNNILNSNKSLIDSPDFGSLNNNQQQQQQQQQSTTSAYGSTNNQSLTSNISLTLPKSPPTSSTTTLKSSISNSSNSLYNNSNSNTYQSQPQPQQAPLSYNSVFDFGGNSTTTTTNAPIKPTTTTTSSFNNSSQTPQLSYNSSFDFGNNNNSNNSNNNNNNNSGLNSGFNSNNSGGGNLNSFNSNLGNSSFSNNNSSNNTSSGGNLNSFNSNLGSNNTLQPLKPSSSSSSSSSSSKYNINLDDHISSSSSSNTSTMRGFTNNDIGSSSGNTFSNNNNNNNNSFNNYNNNNNSNSFSTSSQQQSNYGFDQPLTPSWSNSNNNNNNNNYNTFNNNNSSYNNNNNNINSSFNNMNLNQNNYNQNNMNNNMSNDFNDFNNFHSNSNPNFKNNNNNNNKNNFW